MPEPFAVSFFLSKTGAKTRRIAGPPGKGHIELAREELTRLHQPVETDSDLYAAMFNFGYARVMVEGDTVYIDAPKGLNTAQRDFAIEQEKEGKSVIVNNRSFVEMRQRQPLAKAVIEQLLKD